MLLSRATNIYLIYIAEHLRVKGLTQAWLSMGCDSRSVDQAVYRLIVQHL